jgi:predicted nucleic acid-binding protein
MRLICFDNNVLIWGIKGDATPGQRDMIPRTKSFIESLNNDKEISILIPAVVVAEYLLPVPYNEHANVLKVFNESFIVAPFDADAASKYSLIWSTHKSSGTLDTLLKKNIGKNELKIDGMIVATAYSRNAQCIYSHDEGIRSFAQGFIDVKDIPFIPEQKTVIPSDYQYDWGKMPPNANKLTEAELRSISDEIEDKSDKGDNPQSNWGRPKSKCPNCGFNIGDFFGRELQGKYFRLAGENEQYSDFQCPNCKKYIVPL